jgi:hypothetical protein
MALYYKDDTGAWVQCARAWTKRNGAWTSVEEAWVKTGGAWVRAYNFDVTPPNPPEITLSIAEDFDIVRGVKTLKTRYIRVGVRLPGSANDPDARLTRVLTDYAGKAPTTYMGGTYTSATDATYPTEPWSEWRYNSYGPHKDTSVYIYKQWPRNATAGTIIQGDKTYHFGGWSLDRDGNWSAANQAAIHVPKNSIDVPNVVVKEASFQPDSSGSWRSTGFVSGPLVQQRSPKSLGMWFYGNQFTDSIGAQTTSGEKITIRSAQIYIRRENDNGQANANVYLFWTGYGTVGSLPPTGTAPTRYEITKLGTLAKGQAKWFALPAAFNNNLNTQIKGMGLDWKDPVKADAFPEDYSSVASVAANLRCGEVHIVWEEEL